MEKIFAMTNNSERTITLSTLKSIFFLKINYYFQFMSGKDKLMTKIKFILIQLSYQTEENEK